MKRFLTVATLLALGAISSCAPPGSVRSFPGPQCPPEWEFIYTNHVERQVVCRRITGAPANPADRSPLTPGAIPLGPPLAFPCSHGNDDSAGPRARPE